MANTKQNVAPTKGAPATAAPTKGPAPAATNVAPTTPAPTVVALAKSTNANNLASLAVPVTKGNVCTIAVAGGVWQFVALHTAPTTSCNPAAWPPAYTTGGGTMARKPGAPHGQNGMPYTTHAVHTPTGGTVQWGMVHVYPGMRGTNAKASNPGNGTMVACPAPTGAVCGGNPGTITAALAKGKGLS